jgi:hypothetical protein
VVKEGTASARSANFAEVDQHFIWPLSRKRTPDGMNTSYGPRIDADRWDFHDGIDLPAPVGTRIFAMTDGVVHRAGPADKIDDERGFGSTHVLIRVVDPKDGKDDLFLVYLHLDTIAEEIIPGAPVNRGQLIGTVGQEDATYPHLHFEFRKGGPEEDQSVHPLNYLPFSNTFNFRLLSLDGVNFYDDGGAKRAIRLRFEAPQRQEGDLRGVEVELSGTTVKSRKRRVDFDDRKTIVSDKGDQQAFKRGIAVEGYQKSNLQGDRLSDLHYGVIVKNIAAGFENVALRILDVKNENIHSAQFFLPKLDPNESPVDIREEFEEGQTFPPTGSQVVVLSGNACRPDQIEGQRRLVCQDVGSSSAGLIRAGLRFGLPAQRMSWRLGALINPKELALSRGEAIYPLAFFVGDTLVAAACLRKIGDNKFVTGVLIRSAAGLFREKIDVIEEEISQNKAVLWELELLRLRTRQTTAVLRRGNNVVARINGDTANVEPDSACVGILHRHSGLNVALHVDQLFLTEEPRF